jgi:hypothetical protein
VLQEIWANADDKTPVTLLFANREPRDQLLQQELDALKEQRCVSRVDAARGCLHV